MKLGSILRDKSQPIAPRPVTFWIVGRDGDLKQVKAKASAVLIYLDEEQRENLRVAARADLRTRFEGKEIPDSVEKDEVLYRKLFEVLRDEEPTDKGQYVKFADTLLELRTALTIDQARHIDGEHQVYCETEFPGEIKDEDFAKMVEDGKKNSCADLLTSYGFANAVRVLSSLAGLSSR